jgi:DNA-directed RNA polymerase sigma subunit (sigma70/sigma32)
VPRDLQERSLAVARETEALAKQLGRSPKPREVARALGCSVEQVLEAQQAAASYEAASLDAPTARDHNEASSLVDLLGDEDAAYELVGDRDAIASTWKTLPDVERSVLELRFMHDLNQREIGERIGYSQMHVSRLLRRALNRLELGITGGLRRSRRARVRHSVSRWMAQRSSSRRRPPSCALNAVPETDQPCDEPTRAPSYSASWAPDGRVTPA